MDVEVLYRSDVIRDTSGLWAARIQFVRDGKVYETWLAPGFSHKKEAEIEAAAVMARLKSKAVKTPGETYC